MGKESLTLQTRSLGYNFFLDLMYILYVDFHKLVVFFFQITVNISKVI